MRDTFPPTGVVSFLNPEIGKYQTESQNIYTGETLFLENRLIPALMEHGHRGILYNHLTYPPREAIPTFCTEGVVHGPLFKREILPRMQPPI